MLIVGMTACEKKHYLLKMLEENFKGHFDYIFFVCPTFLKNKTYQEWKYLKDPDVFAVPCDHDYVETALETPPIVRFAKGTNSFIVLDECASSQTVKNRTSELVKLAFHGRHIGLSTIVVTQQLTSNAKPYRMKVSKVVFFYTARRDIFEKCVSVDRQEEKNIMETLEKEKCARLEILILNKIKPNKMKITNRERALILITFCAAFCFALLVLIYPLTAFLIVSLIVKNIP